MPDADVSIIIVMSIKNLSALADALNRHQLFFLAGAGVSVPSHMPTPGKVLYHTRTLLFHKQDEWLARQLAGIPMQLRDIRMS